MQVGEERSIIGRYGSRGRRRVGTAAATDADGVAVGEKAGEAGEAGARDGAEKKAGRGDVPRQQPPAVSERQPGSGETEPDGEAEPEGERTASGGGIAGRHVWWGAAAVAAAALAWSTSFSVTKLALERTPPLTVGALRFGLAALLLAVAVRLQRRWRPPSVRERLEMALAGLLGITLYFTLENFGVDLATASDATLIVASYPALTFALEFALFRQRPAPLALLGMALAVGGVVLIVRDNADAAGSQRLLGDLLLALGGLAWAAYNLLLAARRPRMSALTATYYQTFGGAVAFAALALTEYRDWGGLAPVDIGLMAYLAGVCSIGGFLCYNKGLRSISSSTAVTILNTIPVFGLVSAVVVAGESVTRIQLIGGAVVVLGVVLSLRRDVSRDDGAPKT